VLHHAVNHCNNFLTWTVLIERVADLIKYTKRKNRLKSLLSRIRREWILILFPVRHPLHYSQLYPLTCNIASTTKRQTVANILKSEHILLREQFWYIKLTFPSSHSSRRNWNTHAWFPSPDLKHDAKPLCLWRQCQPLWKVRVPWQEVGVSYIRNHWTEGGSCSVSS
jgi:hypothetical protein